MRRSAEPSWAPDESSILYPNVAKGVASVIDTSGRISEVARGTGPGERVVTARWTPDGPIMYMTVRPGGERALRSVAPAGGPPRLLVRFDDPSRQWARDDLITDGRGIYFVLGDHERDIWVLEVESR